MSAVKSKSRSMTKKQEKELTKQVSEVKKIISEKEKAKAKTRKERRNIKIKISKHKLGLVPVFAMFVIMIVILVNLLGNIEKILSRDEQIAGLWQEYNHRRIQNDALEQKARAEIDDEYVEQIAREQGYRKSDETIFYFHD
jgi:hypothetical protein